MPKTLTAIGVVAGLTLLAATPAFADTVTRTVVSNRYTLTCVITYTELNGNAKIDLLRELASVSNVRCTVSRNP